MNSTKPFLTKSRIFYIFLALIALRVMYYWRSDGFNLTRIENTFPKNGYELTRSSRDEIPLLSTICNQPFFYLGKGSQAYAFHSADGQYVIKLFKCYHLKPIPWLENLPLEKIPCAGFLNLYRNEMINRRKNKVHATLKSYKIAHDLIPEECGLLYLQISSSNDFHQKLTFTDKIGRTHSIDLENYGFIVQRKAELIFPKLSKWIQEQKLDDARELLHSLVKLIITRSLKGVQDQDPDLHKNAGCIGKNAVFIDVGGFHVNEGVKRPDVYINDVRKITRKLANWLKSNSPELAEDLEKQVSTLCTRPNDQEIGIISQNTH